MMRDRYSLSEHRMEKERFREATSTIARAAFQGRVFGLHL